MSKSPEAEVLNQTESQPEADSPIPPEIARVGIDSLLPLPEEPLAFTPKTFKEVYPGKAFISPAVNYHRGERVKEKARADKAYAAAHELKDTIARQQWVTPREFLDYVEKRSGTGTYLAQMVFHSLTSQGLLEQVHFVGVRSPEPNEDFDNSRLEQHEAETGNRPPTQFFGGAHFDY